MVNLIKVITNFANYLV